MEQLDRARWVKINDAELELLVEGGAELQSKAKTLLQRHLRQVIDDREEVVAVTTLPIVAGILIGIAVPQSTWR